MGTFKTLKNKFLLQQHLNFIIFKVNMTSLRKVFVLIFADFLE